MDIFALSLQEIYFALIIAMAALIIALLATWFAHRSDKQPGDRKKQTRRNNIHRS